MIEELQRRVGEPRLAVPGGVLLGESPKPGITEVTGFLPLVSLEARDVEEAVSKYGRKLVGFYRSKDRPPLTLRKEDLSLAGEYFRQPGSVVLLIESGEGGPGNAVFFFWDNGNMNGDLPLLEFPFDAEQLGDMEWQRQPGSLPEPGGPLQSGMPRARFGNGMRLLGVLGAAFVVASGAAAGYRYATAPNPAAAAHTVRSSAPPEKVVAPAHPSLGFSVLREEARLALSWNREAPIVSGADFGMLIATENQDTRRIPLSADELRAGTMLFQPRSEKVQIQLTVIAGDTVASESILVLPRTAQF